MFSNAQGMILHARAPTDVAQDKDLHAGLVLRGWIILRGEQQDQHRERTGEAECDADEKLNHHEGSYFQIPQARFYQAVRNKEVETSTKHESRISDNVT